MAQSVVVLEKDLKLARHIAGGLRSYFSVLIALSGDELRENVARNHPEAVILDIENWRLTDVERLHRDFPEMPIVCTHRIPDDELWTAALTAGACDVCPADDVQVVLTSVLRNLAAQTVAVA